MFLSLSGVIGKTQTEVEKSLNNYSLSAGGGFQKENLKNEHTNFCVIKEANANTTVFYPSGYLEWDKSSAFISKELNAPVFSFHIHDGDLWMYVLYFNGEIVDQFNPIPDYWDDEISDKEIESWKGSAEIIKKYIPKVDAESIRKYLVRWDLNNEGEKAYDNDQFTNEDWQFIDFMNKIGLPYPIDDAGNAAGPVYRLWTKELKSVPVEISKPITESKAEPAKNWWEFWK